MKLERRSFVLGSFGAGLLVSLPVGGAALAMEVSQVAHRILAADKLSMLAEKTAKAVVLLKLNRDVEKDLVELQESVIEFDDILLGFKTGEGNSGVERERFVGVNSALKEVEKLWGPYRHAIEDIIVAKSVDDAHFDMVTKHDEELEHACHEVVRKLEDAYGNGDIDLALALALDFAGRQRMYTQKICKEIAFASLGVDTKEHHEKFTKNAKKFGKIIDVLIEGGNGMVTMAKPPSSEAAAALEEVKKHWLAVEPQVAKLNESDVPDVDDVVDFCHKMDDLSVESDRVALLYEEAVKSTS